MKMNEAWIVFDKGTYWTKHLLKKGFGHLFIISRDKYNWFLFNPKVNGLKFEILPYKVTENVIGVARQRYKNIVYIRYFEKQNESFLALFQRTNCVELVKYILGLRLQGKTPYGFFKHLIKMQLTNKYPVNINEVKLLNSLS